MFRLAPDHSVMTLRGHLSTFSQIKIGYFLLIREREKSIVT